MDLPFTTTYVNTNWESSEPAGQCDMTGAYVNHADLVKEMIWAGGQLLWTGRMVFKDFVFEPNPAVNPAPVYMDPQPIENMRPSKWLNI